MIYRSHRIRQAYSAAGMSPIWQPSAVIVQLNASARFSYSRAPSLKLI